MKLSKVAQLIEIALETKYPYPPIKKMTGEYYQPYYQLMYLLAGEISYGSIVELGVSRGYGLCSLAYGNPNLKPIGLDLNVEPEHKLINTEFHLMSALPVPDFIKKDIMLLHIDTEHSYDNAQNEFNQYESYLSSGAVVLFDDLHAMDDGVLRAFYELPYPKIQDDRLHPTNGYGILVYNKE